MRVLITGHTGLLGRALAGVFRGDHTVIGMSRRAATPDAACDVTDEASTRSRVQDVRPDVVIHAAAMKNPDDCEQRVVEAHRVNALGTRNVALACRDVQAFMVYVSTDYVFDGTRQGAYREEDPACPVNVYGVTKRAGERYVEQILSRYAIVRMCMLYGPGGSDFVRELMALPSGGTAYAFDDQVASVSLATDVARGIRDLVERLAPESRAAVSRAAAAVEDGAFGVYHVVNTGACSRLEFARAVLEAADRGDVRVEVRQLRNDVRPAPRPLRTALAVERLERITGRSMRPWKEAVQAYVASTREKNR